MYRNKADTHIYPRESVRTWTTIRSLSSTSIYPFSLSTRRQDARLPEEEADDAAMAPVPGALRENEGKITTPIPPPPRHEVNPRARAPRVRFLSRFSLRGRLSGFQELAAGFHLPFDYSHPRSLTHSLNHRIHIHTHTLTLFLSLSLSHSPSSTFPTLKPLEISTAPAAGRRLPT